MVVGDGTLWGAGDAYERYMGRWSRKVAQMFTAWLETPPQSEWIDVGCGTGALTEAILARCSPSRVVAVDSSPAFLEVVKQSLHDDRLAIDQSDATSLPAPTASFDRAVSGLVLNFVADPEAKMREMVRVVRPGGTVALYVWDYAGHMQLMRRFFDAATALDAGAITFDDGVRSHVCRPAPLRNLFSCAGLTEVEVRAIDITTPFENFDDYWAPFLGGTGSAPKYVASLDGSARQQLARALRDQLPTGPDGEILLAARAWAAKGHVRG